ncbi:AGAP007886-PA-like protein [Anopheles sinensis]|uniref:AGAP007886-PA-like protein n=1 Tax=Anopheles sinensis TaxID=74873 RepID=A0A084VP55_ANOSI|nr:AGAP007886-PA-like protein [Anopheles sinensis]
MQCGVETMNDCERSPGRTGLRVNFTEKGEVKERREKFLTAKYGSHQMSLIRKRLAVEMWLYDELQKLFDPPVSRPPIWPSSDELVGQLINTSPRVFYTLFFSDPKPQTGGLQTEAIDVDIDEILDMDTDDIRRSHLFVSIFYSRRISRIGSDNGQAEETAFL